MKQNLKQVTLITLIALLTNLFASFTAQAQEQFSYEQEARILYDLALYKGVSDTDFEPDLGGVLTKEKGVVMLLRLFGVEEAALALTDAEADEKLAMFTDAADVGLWAKKQVAYAVDKKYIKGLPDGSFRPKQALNGKLYCSMILQMLGYDGDFDYNTAATSLSQIGGLTSAQAIKFNSDTAINRDSLVGISFGSLQARTKAPDSKKVIEILIEKGIVDKQEAIVAGVIKGLSSLTISNGQLSPSFNPSIFQYTASVSSSVYSITVNASAEEGKVYVNDTLITEDGGSVNLSTGNTTITVSHRSQFDELSTDYYITMTREAPPISPSESSNNNLALLSISGGSLSPEFNTNITNYSVSVTSAVHHITATAELADASASLRINGIATANNTVSAPINLVVGENRVVVRVQAENGATKDYTVTVIKAPKPLSPKQYSYEKEARKIYDSTLFNGVSDTTFESDLGGVFTREQGIVMLLRIFGVEEEALALTDEEVDSKLALITDAADVTHWAKKQIAYAIDKGYVKVMPDGSFGPKQVLNARAYSSMILQMLGYDGDFNYRTAALSLAKKAVLQLNKQKTLIVTL
ncbi:S-layer homology domain-containing protein [Natronincola peptidivorans]|uniref:S-layer homology domain-containing protein n=1 Tax=Natronincola peptidivorans TaxID=426128 RepID=A0A1I0B406_9FIRM|nr:cadherin-like beta sandwich domain-containing protein [Natronincola peptidivorans]SET01109.1 S-layer homology domain-containing protein [Natronincola peptidivorans]